MGEQYPGGNQIREFRGSFRAGFWGRKETFRIQNAVAFSFKKILLSCSACSFTQSKTCGCSPRLGVGGTGLVPLPTQGLGRTPSSGPCEPVSLCLWGPWDSMRRPCAGPHPVLLTNHPPSCCCPQAETLPWGEGGCTLTCASCDRKDPRHHCCPWLQVKRSQCHCKLMALF